MKVYYELRIDLQLSCDVPVAEAQTALAELLNRSMLFDERMKVLHQEKGIKHYVFCLPSPIEPDRVYHQGRLYRFQLHTTRLPVALSFRQCLPKVRQGVGRVVNLELAHYEPQFIERLVTLTPVNCTVNNRSWLPEDGLGLLAERLQQNTLKKCRALDPDFAVPEGEDLFFERVELLNQKPISVKYRSKGTSLLGHKLRLDIKPQPWAQQMGRIVLGEGLLEKNSIGWGYCIARR